MPYGQYWREEAETESVEKYVMDLNYGVHDPLPPAEIPPPWLPHPCVPPLPLAAAFARAKSREEGLKLDDDDEDGGVGAGSAWAPAAPKGVRTLPGDPSTLVMEAAYVRR